MNRLLVAGAVAATLALPPAALAAAGAPLPYSLTFAPTPGTIVNTGKVSGRFGGVAVTGTYTGTTTSGNLALQVSGRKFATGTYACKESTCEFTGSIDGKDVMSMTVSSFSTSKGAVMRGTGSASSDTFPTYGAWVSAVAGWTKKAELPADARSQVISDASRAR